MQAHWAIQNAKNQFSKVVDTALQGTPQVVTRRGVPVVVVVSAVQYNLLTQKEHADGGFARFLLSMPTGADDFEPDNFGQSDLELREAEF
ncbi:MAG: type II toxin-antitoxin system prevent-host-death family antitoxin [Holophagales bacterium]|jgi:prevent-host-death family protein|nr:type II toxin-antitoxin system prevent-host-death family antitoxin [Holophagales bacterium]